MQGQEESGVGLRNWVAFFAFTILAVFGIQLLFPQEQPAPVPPSAPVESPASVAPGVTGSLGPAAAADPAAPDAAAAEELAATEISRLSVTNAHSKVELTNLGGRVTSWVLLDHPSYWSADEPLDLVLGRPAPPPAEGEEADEPPRSLPVRDDAAMLPLQVITGDDALDARLAKALHLLEQDELGPGRKRVTMRWSDGRGTAVEKILVFQDEPPVTTIEARLTVNGAPRDFHLGWGPGVGDHSPAQSANMYFQRGRLVYGIGGDLDREDRPDQADRLPFASVDFAGLEDSFFAVLFIPGAPDEPGASSLRNGFGLAGTLPPKPDGKKGSKKDWPEHVVLLAPFSPGAPVQSLYVGPRDADTLERVDALFAGDRHLGELADLGTIIGPIARFMRTVLVWLHDHVGNWGVAIILLVLMIRAVLFPLTHWQLKQMRIMQDKMAIAKPKIDAIKAKFRKLPRDMETRQREHQETMAVYSQTGINPAKQFMGCLPLLLSMPFFFALFRLLQAAPEFRHQGFLGWSDLSAADPSHIWPILTGATTFISQKIGMSKSTGNSEMESMQRNMLIMFPIMFVFFCWSAPLGLVVYWTTNNVVQIGQQLLLKVMLPTPDPDEQPGSKPKKKNKTKNAQDQNKTQAESESKPAQGGGSGRRGKRRRR